MTTPTHTCPKHAPGSGSCYRRHGCRCDPCSREVRRQWKRSRHRANIGDRLYVPAEPVTAHVAALLECMTVSEVARRANIEMVSVRRIARGDVATVRRDRAERLLAVQPAAIRDQEHGWANREALARRMDALNLRGWSNREIAQRAGLPSIRPRTSPYTFAAVLAAVDAVYSELWDVDAPHTPASRRTQAMAQKRGAVPAAAWDDGVGPHGIDNPSAVPVVTPPRPPGLRGGLPKFYLSDLQILADEGYTLAQSAERLGVTVSAIEHRCRRPGGRPELLDKLHKVA